MLCEVDRPSPMPAPMRFVVKNGSKIHGSTSALIPGPVSWISTHAPTGVIGERRYVSGNQPLRPSVNSIGSS